MTNTHVWNAPADDATIDRTIAALQKNGIMAEVLPNGKAAFARILAMIPPGSEVMTMQSVTLETIGVTAEINESERFDAVKPKLMRMDAKTQGKDMRRLGAAPDWAIGSVHAVTENGELLIASNTGSQMSAYAYAAKHVIWVVGAQKVVKDKEAGIRRIYEYVLPLESERAHKAYGVPGSNVSKLLTINNEVEHGRATLLLVKETLGF